MELGEGLDTGDEWGMAGLVSDRGLPFLLARRFGSFLSPFEVACCFPDGVAIYSPKPA